MKIDKTRTSLAIAVPLCLNQVAIISEFAIIHIIYIYE